MIVTAETLKWRMRRGVLELDHIFTSFLDQNYTKLSGSDKLALISLLECQDPLLLDWLLYRRSLPSDNTLKRIVLMILDSIDNNS